MNDQQAQMARLHHIMIHSLIKNRTCPSSAELASETGLPQAEVAGLLRELSAIHGIVLQPHIVEPWIIHPFSLTPTLNWIQGEHGGWWAPCVWCGFGIAALVGGQVTLHTRYGGEGESLTIPILNGEPGAFADLLVHFAIPPAKAWENVHQHCALVLPFRSVEDITAWCGRHHFAQGEAVPLSQVATLARKWYGSHAGANWHKWTVPEAQLIFQSSGLESDFWNLGAASGEF